MSTTASDRLDHEFRLVIQDQEVDLLVDEQLQTEAGGVSLPGFRRGKVPLRVLRHRFGGEVRKRVLERVIGEKAQEACEERGITPAFTPSLLPSEEPVENGMAVTMRVVALPMLEPIDFASFELERMVVEVTDEEVDGAIAEIAASQSRYVPIEEQRPVEKGDTVIVHCRASRDGEAFAELDDQDTRVTLTEERGHPDWIEALVGAGIDETRIFMHTITPGAGDGEPADEVEVTATVKAIETEDPVTVDDEFAQLMGCEDLEQLRELVRARQAHSHGERCQALFSVGLMDKLTEYATFPVPDFMVDAEYSAIRDRMQPGPESGLPGSEDGDGDGNETGTGDGNETGTGDDDGTDQAVEAQDEAGSGDDDGTDQAVETQDEAGSGDDDGTDQAVETQDEAGSGQEAEESAEEEQDPEMRAIAERRVKLGLLMREVGRQNNISVEEHELEPAVRAWASRFGPERRDRMHELAMQSPRLVETIASEVYESKLVTFISELATITETTVTLEELGRREMEVDDAAVEE